MKKGDRVAVMLDGERFLGIGNIAMVDMSSSFPYRVDLDDSYIDNFKKSEVSLVNRHRGTCKLRAIHKPWRKQ